MKIASLANAFSANGGVGNYMMRLHRAWGKAGHESYFIHADSQAEQDASGHLFFVEGFDRFPWEGNCAATTAKVMALLEQIKPDIVHIQSCNNTVLEVQVRQNYKCVKSLHAFDFCPSGNKFHYALEKTCHHATSLLCIPRMAYKRCTLSKRPDVLWRLYRESREINQTNKKQGIKIIVPSEFTRQKAIETHYDPAQVETALYCTEYPEEPGPLRYDSNLILFSGRLVGEKGLEKLLAAATYLKKSAPWEIAVAGDGPEAKKMTALVERYQLKDRVRFLGWRPMDEVIELYRRATLVVVPSVWPEPFGAVGTEAMSYGKPVIAFAVGGIPEWLDHNRSGYLIKPFNVKEMGKAIEYLLDHPRKAKEMGEFGRNLVKEKFSFEIHTKRLLEIYQKVLNP